MREVGSGLESATYSVVDTFSPEGDSTVASTRTLESKSRLTGFLPWLRISVVKFSREAFPASRDFGMPDRTTTIGSFFLPVNGRSGDRSFLGKFTTELTAEAEMSESDRPSESGALAGVGCGLGSVDASFFSESFLGAALRQKPEGSKRARTRQRGIGVERLMAGWLKVKLDEKGVANRIGGATSSMVCHAPS